LGINRLTFEKICWKRVTSHQFHHHQFNTAKHAHAAT